MRRNSLALRLVAASGVWIVGTLIVAGVLLVVLFRDHIERRFDAALFDELEELVAASEIDESGDLALNWVPVDPRFNRPYSGWYWQITHGERIVARSESLWDRRLGPTDPVAGVGARIEEMAGPAEARMRALVHDITLPDGATAFTFVVAGPVAAIERDVADFTVKLSLTLAVFGAGLLGAVFVQVRFGLRPLRAIQRALAEVRAGRADRLSGSFPEEIQPVVSELNALLDHTTRLLDRARTQAGNLAHALKNPLTVIRNEARSVGGERGDTLRDQVTVMNQWIDRFLSRARAAGSGAVLGPPTPVKDVVEDLRFSMKLLYNDRGLEIGASGLEGLCFQGDAQDLEEMLGNLVDNACKWARGKVLIRGERVGSRLRIRVDDDGPGVPDAMRENVLQRGRRLDERVPGTGLGLDIVQDIAELYEGSVRLGPSPLGGICAELDLPAAL
jgi:signal transduction histidine kinase